MKPLQGSRPFHPIDLGVGGLFHSLESCPENGPACQGGGGAGDLANLYLGKRAIIKKKGTVPIAEGAMK